MRTEAKNIGKALVVVGIVMVAIGLIFSPAIAQGITALGLGPPPLPHDGKISVSRLSVAPMSQVDGVIDWSFGHYWHEPLDYWRYFNPRDPPEVGIGTEFYLLVPWSNTGTESFRGHVDVKLYKPDGSAVSLNADMNQDKMADPYNGWGVRFHWALNQAGEYEIEATLWVTDSPSVTLDRWSGTVVKSVAETYHLTIRVEPIKGGGTVPESGDYTYEKGRTVSITAWYNPGYEFSHWSGDVSGTARTIAVYMDSNKEVVANFREAPPNTYNLSAWADPPIGGWVELTPVGGTYEEGITVEMKANAYPSYEFDRWGRDASGTANPTSILMSNNKYVVAYFFFAEQPEHVSLTTEVVQGEGTVTPSGTFVKGEYVILRAWPAEGYVFEKWSGDASGSQNPTTIIMNENKIVNAHFKGTEPEQVTLTLMVLPEGGGSITLAQSSQVTVDKGEIINLQAFPNEGWEFDRWSGDVAGTDTFLRVVMDSDKTAIANFREKGLVDVPLAMMIAGGLMIPTGLVLVVKGRKE